MKEKKEVANWYIAATHWLTSTILSAVVGMVLAFVISFIFGFVLAFIFESTDPQVNTLVYVVSVVLVILITPFSFYIGTKYGGARYINKKYIIKNSIKITKLSTIYLIVIGGGYRVYQLITLGGISFEELGLVFGIIVFYFVSKKYILNTEIQNQQ